jgi:TM2 domain-containing membrane protein YozV
MKKTILWTIFLSVSFSFSCFSQIDQKSIIPEKDPVRMFTKNLEVDSRIAFNESNDVQAVDFNAIEPSRKSPFLGGIFSAIIPGAGQVYAGKYIEAGIFAVIEGTLITLAVVYNNKGNNQTNYFENYADQNWSVVRYAQWLNQYANANIAINPDNSLPPWERVNWTQLNAAEIGSHKLPIHGTQQYYELIGKYDQYSPGWDDYTYGSDYYQVSPNLLSYADMRGKANSLYTDSNTAIIGIFVNHALSVIDAVWDVSRYNNQLAFKFRLNPQYYYADSPILVPTINLSYSF